MSDDVTLYATNPSAMVEAQTGLIAWCEGKVQACAREREEGERLFNALHGAKMSVAAAKKMIRGAMRRAVFYQKVKAALEAGYYIVPPFPVQTFAVRTSKSMPKQHYGHKHLTWDEKPESLPIGQGHYWNPVAKREYHSTEEHKQPSGSITRVDKYWNTEFRDVGFPVALVKPEIITATGEALKRKIFDSLGMLPAYRKADPIVVGQIEHWKNGRQPVTFFLAWWLDTQDL
jgi:hypothetical protein